MNYFSYFQLVSRRKICYLIECRVPKVEQKEIGIQSRIVNSKEVLFLKDLLKISHGKIKEFHNHRWDTKGGISFYLISNTNNLLVTKCDESSKLSVEISRNILQLKSAISIVFRKLFCKIFVFQLWSVFLTLAYFYDRKFDGVITTLIMFLG